MLNLARFWTPFHFERNYPTFNKKLGELWSTNY